MYIGIDLGGTNLKAGVVSGEGSLISKIAKPTEASLGFDTVFNNICRLISYNLKKYPKAKAIGVGVPGVVSTDGIVKIAPNLIGWENIPLVELLSKKYSLPVRIDNDSNTAALAELELGAGMNEDNFLYITLGTGVGGTIIIDRRIYRGLSGGAGEVGHIIIDNNAELNVNSPYRTGILEEFVGRNQITKYAANFIKDYPDSLLHNYDRTDPYFITESANKGDEAALSIYRKIGHYLGLGLISALNLLDIYLIVVGGGISLAHPLLLESALDTIKQRAMPTVAKNVRIEKAHFSKEAGIIGAALLGKKSSNVYY